MQANTQAASTITESELMANTRHKTYKTLVDKTLVDNSIATASTKCLSQNVCCVCVSAYTSRRRGLKCRSWTSWLNPKNLGRFRTFGENILLLPELGS